MACNHCADETEKEKLSKRTGEGETHTHTKLNARESDDDSQMGNVSVKNAQPIIFSAL